MFLKWTLSFSLKLSFHLHISQANNHCLRFQIQNYFPLILEKWPNLDSAVFFMGTVGPAGTGAEHGVRAGGRGCRAWGQGQRAGAGPRAQGTGSGPALPRWCRPPSPWVSPPLGWSLQDNHVITSWIFTCSVHDQSRDTCVISHRISAWWAMWSVQDQVHDQCMISHVIGVWSATWTVHAQSRDHGLLSCVITVCSSAWQFPAELHDSCLSSPWQLPPVLCNS